MDFTVVLRTFIHSDKEILVDTKHPSEQCVCIIKFSYRSTDRYYSFQAEMSTG